MSRTPAIAASVHVDVHAEPAAVEPEPETASATGRGSPVDVRARDRDDRDDGDRGSGDDGGDDRGGTAAFETSSLAELSDEDLLGGIRLQSEGHFAELYNRYFQRIYSFVYARMRNHAETEEVVQETFLAVFRSIENYRGQSSLLSWIYGIAKNTTNNSLRRARSQHERIELADDEDLLPRPSLAAAPPDEQLDLSRFKKLLSDRLEGLADWQIEIFEMRHFRNLSIPDIASCTGRSSDAVRSSLYRVKRLFLEAAASSTPPASRARGVRP